MSNEQLIGLIQESPELTGQISQPLEIIAVVTNGQKGERGDMVTVNGISADRTTGNISIDSNDILLDKTDASSLTIKEKFDTFKPNQLEQLADPPTNPQAGQIYYNTTVNRAFVFNGGQWIPADALDVTAEMIVQTINGSSFIINDANIQQDETHRFVTDNQITSWDNKVDKVDGKGLSTNDYTTLEKNKLANIEDNAQENVIETIQKNGVDLPITDKKVNIDVPTKTSELTNDSNFAVDSNYIHTDNNYTTDEKNKLSNIQDGANVNIIETIKRNGEILTVTDKSVDVIVPTKTSELTNDSNLVVDATYVHTDNNYTTTEKNKLANIQDGAEANVNPDWNATSGDAQILNKPTTISGYGITDAYTKGEVDAKVSAVYKYKGSVATYADLPSTNLTVGDVYNVIDTGINYGWTGSEWDNLGGVEPLASLTNNGLMSKEDFAKLAGIESGATKNDTDANLRNRATHTGTQLASTISDFASTVRDTVLTGLSTTTNAVISATDTILIALGKLQKQISDNLSALNSHISDAVKHITSDERTLWNTVSNKLDATANAVSATKLQTARKINGVDFDGTQDITVSGGGDGDMKKSIYDTNDDGIVDNSTLIDGIPSTDLAMLSHDVSDALDVASFVTVLVTVSKTLTLADNFKMLKCYSASNIILTIPTDATTNFPINSAIVVVRYGVGAVTIAGDTGVTINSEGNKKSITNQYDIITLKKITTNEWLLTGALA